MEAHRNVKNGVLVLLKKGRLACSDALSSVSRHKLQLTQATCLDEQKQGRDGAGRSPATARLCAFLVYIGTTSKEWVSEIV